MYRGRKQSIGAFLFTAAWGICGLPQWGAALDPPVEIQPLGAQVRRVAQALQMAGAPLTAAQQKELDAALANPADDEAVAQIQAVLDPLCLVHVRVTPESRVKASAGAAARELVEQGWSVFLVKVHNEAGVTAPLRCSSPQMLPVGATGKGDAEPPAEVVPADVRERWLDLEMFDRQPLEKSLSGLPIEYRILELFARDRGRREAKLLWDVGQGTQDLGFRNEVNLLFTCRPSVDVVLEVVDFDGSPTMGQFVFRDDRDRIYPLRARRTEPDFFFHDQVYRSDGQSVRLPPGEYEATFTRGPEYRVLHRRVTVPHVDEHRERFELERWIHMAQRGWFSGDHHVHAAGCAHYFAPSQGVEPSAMMRHIEGEDLNVGCVLTWGPCWYHQKQFFQGGVDPLSSPTHLMRYDVEVSGFPSSHAGHLVLLRLQEDDFPGTTRIEEWPSWTLPIMRWAREQGGVAGYAHSGWGLEVPAESLPTYDLPRYDGIGANEYIVNVTHGTCDFISAVDTPAVWELNIWYHTLNCGFTTRISGETDFPCIYGDRVGLGRVYVKMPPNEPLDFDAWVDGVRQGRSYCSDGLTHLVDLQVNELGVGEPGAGGEASRLAISSGNPLAIEVQAAALLSEQPQDAIRRRPLAERPYWHIERARIGDSRTVPVELVVNGQVVATQAIAADGSVQQVDFDYTPQRSCWVAVRIFPAAHTNPVFVEVDGQPIRASRRSAGWCLASVDRCWATKSRAIRESEQQAAAEAYEHARQVYRRLADESYDDGEFAVPPADEPH